MNRIYFFYGIIFILISCKSEKTSLQKDYYIENDSINLYAFIGERISVTQFNPNSDKEQTKIDTLTGEKVVHKSIIMDYAFNVKYKVIKNVFNNLKTDTINFVAFDHYGQPKFENYQNVLLYISYNKEKKSYYHQKYTFDVVTKNSNGKWKGMNGKNLKSIFEEKQNGVFKERGIFK